MATELPFPKTRHVALVITAPSARGGGTDLDATARAEAAQAVVLPLEALLVDAGAATPQDLTPVPAALGAAWPPEPAAETIPPVPASVPVPIPVPTPVPASVSLPAADVSVVEPGTLPRAVAIDLSQPRDGDEAGPCVLAGPTCDSMDVLYEKTPYELPVSLEIGDKVLIEGTGAYTSTYSAVAFNGFLPLQTFHI